MQVHILRHYDNFGVLWGIFLTGQQGFLRARMVYCKFTLITTRFATIDLFSLDGLFSHFRTRDILLRIVLLSALKLFIHIHGTIRKFESKNSQEYHHMV